MSAIICFYFMAIIQKYYLYLQWLSLSLAALNYAEKLLWRCVPVKRDLICLFLRFRNFGQRLERRAVI